jgi:integrase
MQSKSPENYRERGILVAQKTNVNISRRPRRRAPQFGENLHYLTEENLQRFWDTIDDYGHKLMLRLIYELGCRVGEFVQIRLRHINFREKSIFFPAENTKTKERRTSYVPQGLMNELKDYLKREGMVTKRDETIKEPDAFLLPSTQNSTGHMTTRRWQHIFKEYIDKAGLQEVYGHDNKGRPLYKYTIHSLRHSHVRHYVQRVPLGNSRSRGGRRSQDTEG